ncbi:MAG: hypothetical protein ABIO40_08330 [Devosia sp.]
MTDEPFSALQMAQLKLILKEAINEAFADAGLRIDSGDHQDEAREDFRFVRRLRRIWDSGVTRTGTIVLTAIVGVAVTILGMGLAQWINRGGQQGRASVRALGLTLWSRQSVTQSCARPPFHRPDCSPSARNR